MLGVIRVVFDRELLSQDQLRNLGSDLSWGVDEFQVKLRIQVSGYLRVVIPGNGNLSIALYDLDSLIWELGDHYYIQTCHLLFRRESLH